MPCYLGTPSLQNVVLHLCGDTSFDFNAEDISYTVELARDYQFRQMVYREEHVVLPMTQTAAPAAEPKTAAELIASRWSNVDGVTVTIKGAQPTGPVVWLTGDTDPHADEIKAQGGKWSNKRAAYYVRVA